MRKSIVTLLVLLPLAILCSLSCPVKQNIKQLLGIPVSVSMQLERNSSTTCVYTTEQQKKSAIGVSKQHHLDTKFVVRNLLSMVSVSTNNFFTQYCNRDQGKLTPVPIFLVYRKLII